MRHILLFLLMFVARLSAVTALSTEDPVKADGEYSFPAKRAGNAFTWSLSGTFGGGTATIGYINAAGAFTSLGRTMTAAGSFTAILPQGATAGQGVPAVSLSGSTSPSITTTIVKADAAVPVVAVSDIQQSGAITGQVPTWNGSVWAASSITENWVFEGDSWTAGTSQGNDRETWPYYLLRSAGVRNKVTGYNVATAGQTAATMVSTFSAQVAPYLTTTSGRPSTAFIFAGINDAAGTTTQLRDNLRAMWTSSRNAGATVVAFTLPHRTAAGGWSQADWATINAQIIADSSYYDHLVRMDILCSNALGPDYTDNLHVNTAAHERIAAAVWRILNRQTGYPITPPDLMCSAVSSVTLAANTRRNLPFSETYDANGDGANATVGSDANTEVFTAPVDGTYEITASVLLGSIASGDSAYISAWITPISTGIEAEHRLHYNIAAGANMGIGGQKRVRMFKGDKVSISVYCSKANSSLLTNGNFSTFGVRLVSIP